MEAAAERLLAEQRRMRSVADAGHTGGRRRRGGLIPYFCLYDGFCTLLILYLFGVGVIWEHQHAWMDWSAAW